MRHLSVEQAKKEFYSILEAGEPVIVELDGVPVAQLSPSSMTPEFREETLRELAEILSAADHTT